MLEYINIIYRNSQLIKKISLGSINGFFVRGDKSFVSVRREAQRLSKWKHWSPLPVNKLK